MSAFFTLAVLAVVPQPIDLDSISVDRARALSGRVVVASFVVVKPTYTWPDRKGGSITVAGAADQPDEVERGAVMRGRVRVDEGKRITLLGKLRVIDHAGYFVNGRFVPSWTEIRVEQER